MSFKAAKNQIGGEHGKKSTYSDTHTFIQKNTDYCCFRRSSGANSDIYIFYAVGSAFTESSFTCGYIRDGFNTYGVEYHESGNTTFTKNTDGYYNWSGSLTLGKKDGIKYGGQYINIPVFTNSVDAIAYAKGEGDLSKAENYKDLLLGKTEFRCYYDGKGKNEYYKLVCENDNINSENFNVNTAEICIGDLIVNEVSDTQIELLKYGYPWDSLIKTTNFPQDKQKITYVPYTQGGFNFTITDVLKNWNYVNYKSYLVGGFTIESIFKHPWIVCFDVCLRVKYNGNYIYSSPFSCTITITNNINSHYSENEANYTEFTHDIPYETIVKARYDGAANIKSHNGMDSFRWIKGTGEGDSGYIKKSDNIDDRINLTELGYSSTNLGSNYALNATQARAFMTALWNDSFIKTIFNLTQNPIDNVVSFKRFPFSIADGTSAQSIKIGNVDMGVNAYTDFKSMYRTIGTFEYKGIHGNFLDLEKTTVYIYLPFIGFQELNPKLIHNKLCTVIYIVDYVTGDIIVKINSMNELIATFDGNCSTEIHLSSSGINAQSISRFMGIADVGTNALQSAVSPMPEVALPMAGVSSLKGVANTLLTPMISKSTGTRTSEVNSWVCPNCFLTIIAPQYQEASSYAHNFGKPCNLTKRIGDLSGFTSCAGDIDLDGIPADEEEKRMIRSILKSGFLV